MQSNIDGALATVEDSATGRKTTYYYDLTDRMVKYVETGTDYYHSVGYEYDTDNNLTTLVETTNGTNYTTSYAYDEDNRVSSVTTNGTTVEYTYDDYGRITTQVTKRGDATVLTETYTYVDPSEATTSSQIATYKTETANHAVTYAYTYDDNGNILSVSDGTHTTSYVYDSANQLIRENNKLRNRTYTWTYDNAGNIQSYKTYAYTTGDLSTATPSVDNSYAYGDEDWGDLLTGYNGTSITYDEIGNPNGYGDRSFTWEHGRQLATQTKSGVEWEYAYDTNGMRTSRTSDSKTYEYVYSGDKLVQLTITDHTTSPETVQLLEFTYDAAGQPLTMTYDGNIYYYLINIQGDVMGLYDESGNLKVSYVYEGYGAGYYVNNTSAMEATLAVVNPLAYRGYVLDMGTNLYYLQSRYYDPTLGRFINEDVFISTGQGISSKNMFVYCLNNPIMGIDFDGCRTYFINGINNEEEEGAPDYAIVFADDLENSGVENVHVIPVFNRKTGKFEIFRGVAQVILEMMNINMYTDQVVAYIMNDLKQNPLAEGEELNIIGYSGGGQIALNAMEKLQAANVEVDNIILIGTPVLEVWNTTAEISLLYSLADPLSWNVGYGFDAYYMGAVGHTGYFAGDNLKRTVSLVENLIK